MEGIRCPLLREHISNDIYLSVLQPDIKSYGFDGEADLPEEIDASETVVVPETICPLDEEAFAIFCERLHFVQDEDRRDTQQIFLGKILKCKIV